MYKTVGLIKGLFFLRWKDKLSSLYILKYCFALETNVAGMWRCNDIIMIQWPTSYKATVKEWNICPHET